jgi:hypothetical protein
VSGCWCLHWWTTRKVVVLAVVVCGDQSSVTHLVVTREALCRRWRSAVLRRGVSVLWRRESVLWCCLAGLTMRCGREGERSVELERTHTTTDLKVKMLARLI